MLRFSPYAWSKVHYLARNVPTEVSFFGVSNETDPAIVEDVVLFGQEVSKASVDADGEQMCDFIDEMFHERGLEPWRFTRIWMHTHPGSSTAPSPTDEATFRDQFGTQDWAAMLIFPKDMRGKVYCRVKIMKGAGNVPAVNYLCKCKVDYTLPFLASDEAAWAKEVAAKVVERKWANWGQGKSGYLGQPYGTYPSSYYQGASYGPPRESDLKHDMYESGSRGYYKDGKFFPWSDVARDARID